MDEQLFTNHVRGLLEGEQSVDDQIIRHLKQVICKKLQRLGYWQLPPRYLGLNGDSWGDSTALDDLVQESYMACIFNGLTRFAEYLMGSETVEGAVHQKIEWYLQQRKRDGNPLATRVYKNVRAASETLVELGVAKTTSDCDISGHSVILAQDNSSPNSEIELEEIFAEELHDAEFVKGIVKECLASLRMTEQRIKLRLKENLSGYVVNHLVALLSNETKLGHEVSLDSTGEEEGSRNVFESLPDAGTPSPDARYRNSEDYEILLETIRETAESNISNHRIRDRVLKALDLTAELINGGEDVSQLSIRKLADRLGVAKSSLARDFARLRPDFDSDSGGEES